MPTSSRAGLRWSVPVGVAALVVGGAVLGPVLSASAEVELPERSPDQLLADLTTARVDAFWGTVTQRAHLGLPELPHGVGSEYDTDPLALLTGEHDVRVWADGHRARVSVHGTMGESGVVADDADVWTWSSDERAVTHLVLPDDAGGDERRDALADALPPVTPERLAALVLERLEPSTRVTAGENTLVAGRPAYELVLEPRDDASLVAAVRIAVDAGERVPTRVQVFADGVPTPALEVGFTRLVLERPDPSVFDFSPPADATVRTHVVPEHDHGPGHDGPGAWAKGSPDRHGHDGQHGDHGDDAADPRRGVVVGDGWDAVAVGRVPAALGTPDGELGAFLRTLPTVDGPWGSGRLLTSHLFTALLTDDGRLLVGAVGADTLLAAAGDPAAALD